MAKELLTSDHRTTEQPVDAKAKADYRFACVSCGQKPTVTLVDDKGREHRTKLCGPCCFGEAKCVDPSEWATA